MNIILFGAGHHSSYCIDIIEQEGKYNILGIIDSLKEIGSTVNGYKILGRLEDLNQLSDKYKIDGGFISIGDNWARSKVYENITFIKRDFKFINAIHPSCTICKNVKVGRGNLFMAGSVIDTNALIDNFVWLGCTSLLEHDSVMHDFSSISSGSITGGEVEIGKYAAITLGVTIIDRIKIGENAVIGSGSLVMNDIPADTVAYGSPAKIIRFRKPGENFLK